MSHPEHVLPSPDVSLISRLTCRLGIHRWECKDRFFQGQVYSFMRCRKPGCPRYGDWMTVNVEPDPRHKLWP